MKFKITKTASILAAVVLTLVIIYIFFFRNEKESVNIKPELSVAPLSITGINEETIDADASLLIDNPLPVEVRTNRVDYGIQVNGVEVMRNRYDQPIAIRSDTSTTVKLPVKILSEELVQVLSRLEEEKADSANYTISAQFHLDVPVLGSRILDFTETKRLPALRLPEVRAGDLSVDRLRWEGSSLTLDVEVNNPNDFPLQFKEVHYEVVIDDDHTMSGDIPGVTKIPANGVATVPVELHTDHKELLKTVWKTLFEDESTSFTITYESTVVSENDLLNNTPLVMKTKGTLAELKDLPKHSGN